MFYQMHAGDYVHRTICPGQFFPLQVNALELTPRRILLRMTSLIGGEKANVRPELRDMAEGFPVRRSQIQERSRSRRCGHEPGPGIEPRKKPHASPIHPPQTSQLECDCKVLGTFGFQIAAGNFLVLWIDSFNGLSKLNAAHAYDTDIDRKMSSPTAHPPADEPTPRGVFKPLSPFWVLFILTGLNLLNYIDRSILNAVRTPL